MKRRAFAIAAIAALAIVVAASAAGVPVASSGAEGETRSFVLMILYAALALVLSFLCSVAEAVLLSVTPSFIANQRKQGKRFATRLKKVKSSIDRSLAAILTLNTIAHTIGAGGAGAEAAAYYGERWVGVAMAVLTLLILFLSEIVPKTLGAVYWRRLSGPTAVFVQILIISLYPLIWISELLTRLITGGKPVHVFSREEFAALAEIGVERGQIAVTESRIVKNILRFKDLQVEAIMTPRTVVLALQRDLTIDEALARHPELPFTRIPIFGASQDDIHAFVLKIDLLRAKLDGRGEAPLHLIGREIHAVIETASLESVLERLLGEQQHILLVLDEFGGVEGLVTLEDVVETLIGAEIVDEADEIEDLRELARRRWEERRARLERRESTDPPSPAGEPSDRN